MEKFMESLMNLLNIGFWIYTDLFLNIVSFNVDTLDPAMLQLF